jgi:16S rRNA (uracil1498-N3)-methyltransferase
VPHRFFVPGHYVRGDVVNLPAEESEHAVRVLRLGPGAEIGIFNGAGREFSAVIASVGKKGVTVDVGAAVVPREEPGVAITLVQAVLKGDKMDDVIRDAVMVGVAAIQPVVSQRTEVSLVALHRGARRERWARVAISSAKQCGRAVVPRIAEPALLERSLIAPEGALSLVCVEPGLPAGGKSIAALPRVRPAQVQLVIGPEGGWTPVEVARAAPLATLITLGARTLRADATPLVALTALYTHWGEL